MDVGTVHAWQPVTNLDSTRVQLIEFIKGQDNLSIHLADLSGNHVKIIYDRNVVNLGDWVWAARHTPEAPSSHLSAPCMESIKQNPNLDRNAYCFYKLTDSEFMSWFDQLSFFELKDFPEVEHHLYYLMDDVVEILSDYEPKFITWKE
ncbi:hypothetical protein DHX103_11400 [Planococcus sp. X10-3]|uniref:hypothetical protein n=1 Tax=Planococcus sp. X10-3 TaxID=3061240 RepID=UPI003BAFD4A6